MCGYEEGNDKKKNLRWEEGSAKPRLTTAWHLQGEAAGYTGRWALILQPQTLPGPGLHTWICLKGSPAQVTELERQLQWFSTTQSLVPATLTVVTLMLSDDPWSDGRVTDKLTAPSARGTFFQNPDRLDSDQSCSERTVINDASRGNRLLPAALVVCWNKRGDLSSVLRAASASTAAPGPFQVMFASIAAAEDGNERRGLQLTEKKY
ncbi:unnamed protein product [Pleuronectes platessa]|uniref:Uncharacterized protein n=1 Tax=Pleuronectes platessa TaxID=8262 RepID=A0A9N7Z6I8_PLEPL|nr:unnamed protein product [Pleuronectes platessa]